MPQRIYWFIAVLVAVSVLAVALPMHPAARIALGLAVFALTVGLIVEFVNRSKGPDLVPGGRNAAALGIDLDQLASRVAALQERTTAQGAELEAAIEAVREAVATGAEQQKTARALELKGFDDVWALRHSQMDSRVEALMSIVSTIEPAVTNSLISKVQDAVDRVYDAADEVHASAAILPAVTEAVSAWEKEMRRQPSAAQFAARDTFLAENMPVAMEISRVTQPLTGNVPFETAGNAANVTRRLLSAGVGSSFKNETELKTWARSQARVEAVVASLRDRLAKLEELRKFSEGVRSRRDRNVDS